MARALDEASIERYKLSSDYAKALHSYEEKAMVVFIKLAKEWILAKHPSIDLSNFDKFLAQCKSEESRGIRPGLWAFVARR